MLYRDDIGRRVWIPPTVGFMVAGFLFALGAHLCGISVISIAPCLGAVGAVVGSAWGALLMNELALRRFEVVYRIENSCHIPELSQYESNMVLVAENAGEYVAHSMFADEKHSDPITGDGILYLGECLVDDKKFKTSQYSDSRLSRSQFEFVRNLFVRRGWADRDYVLSGSGRAIARWMATPPPM